MQLPAFEGKTACCFTGHRPNGLPEGGDEQKEGMIRLKHALIYGVEAAIQCGVTVFWAGGAAGFDMLAAEAVLAWREMYPDIRLCLALPSRTYDSAWPKALFARNARIRAAAAETWFASEADNTWYALRMRNRYLVERADCCMTYLNRSKGGTCYTVNYAMERGIPVWNLAQIL